jgi:hypothetical protein
LLKAAEPAIVTFEGPRDYDENTCGGLWKREKTCCEYGSLLNWKTKSEESLRVSAGSFKTLVRKLNTNLDRQKISKIDNDFDFLAKLVDDTKSAGFIANVDKCMDHLIKVRSSSVCSICAGNFRRHLLGEKAAVSKGDCIAVISSCDGYLLESGYLLKGFKKLITAAKSEMKGNRDKRRARNRINTMQKVLEWPNLRLLIRYIEEMNKGDSSNRLLPYQVCNMVFDLIKPTIFQTMLPVLDYLNNWAFQLINTMHRIRSRNLLEPKSSESRHLNQEQIEETFISLPENILNADSKVLISSNDPLMKQMRLNDNSIIMNSVGTTAVNTSLTFP